MEKIKILFVLSSLVTGGAERVASHLLEYLNREKFQMALCLFEKKGRLLSEVPKDIEIFDLGKKNSWSLPFLPLRLQAVIKNYRPDIVLSMLWYTTVVTALAKILFRNKRSPFFCAYEPQNHKQDIMAYERFKALKSILINYAHNAADLVVVDSYGVAKDISQNYRLSPHAIKVIYNSVDIGAIKKMMGGKAPLPFDEGGLPIIAGFGRLIRRKGFDYLIRAFCIVRKKMPCKLLLIGDGEERASLEQLAKSLNMEKDIILVGYQDNPYKFMARADLFVLSSLWEGFGNVIIEAMACGIPVIATRCPWGPDEIITEGVNGLLVPVKDIDAMAAAMIKLLKDQSLSEKLAKAGKRRAQDFRVEKIAAEYEQTFLEVMTKKAMQA